MSARAAGAALILASLSACAANAVIETGFGPAVVMEDPELAVYTPTTLPDGSDISPSPLIGALVVTEPDGASLPYEAQARAEAALTAYCGGVMPDGLTYYGIGNGGSSWIALPCA
ncbi:hypothetical protein [Wenxinia marina]|uniref:Lipoprotein n=1 Tax=Wenxinia marina DSM 24838 TaxID=1123501 RepID=A0A0D0Q1N8_9RHOB|nr:hypothetical protein [Wenxinia marina]KIQ68489.1 hypothetical protein Wenmar_02759 [Wenxinia marina DSM 24838]GGL66167.1 hypothetical protein GCM10011392_20990 [Wenxinia marina]